MERAKTLLLVILFMVSLNFNGQVFGNNEVESLESFRAGKFEEYNRYLVEERERHRKLFEAVTADTERFVREEVLSEVAEEEVCERVIINSVREAREYEIWSRSNWTREDFEGIIPSTLMDMVPVALEMEDEIGVSALYLIAVAANETGWGRYMAGENNYFNWSNDGKRYFDFKSLEEFKEFSISSYMRGYSEPAHFKRSYGRLPEKITVEVVNTKYAPYLSGGTNWIWTDTVSRIMKELSDKRVSGVAY